MNKKIISAILAGACALSAMSFSAFADVEFAKQEDNQLEKAAAKTYSITAGVPTPALNVTIPTSINAIINPFGVAIEIEDVGMTGATGVTSPVYTITNNTTTFAIDVYATATVKASTGITIGADKGGTDTTKTAQPTVLAAVQTAAGTAINTAPATKVLTFTDMSAANATAPAAKNIMSLPKVDATSGKAWSGYIQIGGTANPKAEWDSKDKLTLTLILDIKPSSASTAQANQEA